jgi:hypothetical protein
VYEVIAGENRREDYGTNQQRLLHLPQELDDIYSRIFHVMVASARQKAGVFLHLVTTRVRPLRVSEPLEATIFAGVTPWKSGTLVDERILRDFECRIIAIGGRILENVHAGQLSSTGEPEVLDVRLLHRTLQTYLQKRGWNELFHKGNSPRNQIWLRICGAFPL